MSNIRLSIIVPVFNRERSIGLALRSIGRRIPDNCEIIVVDDGSTDASAVVAARALDDIGIRRSQIIKQRNGGPGAARNLGARQAQGEYLVFLDSDDLWSSATLDAILSTLTQMPDFALLFLQSVDFTSQIRPKHSDKPHVVALFDDFFAATKSDIETRFASCNVLIPRPVFEAVGGFDETLVCSEDSDLFLRAGQLGATAVIFGDPLIGHRIDPSDRLSCDAKAVVQGLHDMIRKDRAGTYGPTEARARRSFLAGSAVYAIRVAFAQGEVWLAYRTFFQFAMRLALRKPNWLWRLFLTPVLAKLRPQSYPFRWRSRNAAIEWTAELDQTQVQDRVSGREHWPVG